MIKKIMKKIIKKKKFKKIMNLIKTNFKLESQFINERDIEKQLYQFLKGNFPKINFKCQMSLGNGHIDIGIEKDKIGIEIKLENDNGFNRIFNQISRYNEEYDLLGIIFVYYGKVVEDKFEEVKDRLEKNYKNIKIIEIKGSEKLENVNRKSK